jgi:outer membrane lipoprotein carrier protein
MKLRPVIVLFLGLSLLVCPILQPAAVRPALAQKPVTGLDDILSGIEKRYAGTGFSARFDQESTLKAMSIIDTASGEVLFKRAGKMRWVYAEPEKQMIISDGETLWIYRPEDNQVMIGRAPAYFRGGKGASFLSDVSQIRQNFKISLEKEQKEGFYRLKLIPNESTQDLTDIYLDVAVETYDVCQVVTYNSAGDETRIKLKDFHFNLNPDDELFEFGIPEGADVLNLGE